MPERSTTRVVLIRHGESRATVDRIAGGEQGCRGLTERGVQQSRALRERIQRTGELKGATALLASTLPRAVETAEILAPALGLSVERHRDLCEMHPGAGDGLSWDEFDQRFGGFSFEAEPYRAVAPGGESWAEFELRVGAVLAQVVDKNIGGFVVVACHGGVIGASLALLLGLSGAGPRAVVGELRNTSLTEWVCELRPPSGPHWQLVRFNDASHLD